MAEALAAELLLEFGLDLTHDLADHEIGEVLAAAGGPPDRDALAEVMRRHGLTPAQPTAAVS